MSRTLAVNWQVDVPTARQAQEEAEEAERRIRNSSAPAQYSGSCAARLRRRWAANTFTQTPAVSCARPTST